MRICLIYDCLYPNTVGGAERWYRNLAERLATDGHEVTYLTLRQWEVGQEPDVPGVRVVAVGPRMGLYTKRGRRKIGPPLRFGAGVLWHLLRHGRRYDAVHTASFPYFSLLAAAAARPFAGYELVVDWHEVWSAEYWREYLGPAGWIGIAVQRRCAHVSQRAFCFSELHAARLAAQGLRGRVAILGEFPGSLEPEQPLDAGRCVVFAGRLIPEKRAPNVVAAVALAAERIPGLRGVIYGDGPRRDEVLDAIAQLTPGLVRARGFVDAAELHDSMRRACAMVLPSRREGHGMIVVEASACGTPSVVVRGADNASVELVADGVNGVIADSADPLDLADAIVRIHEAGETMRESTREWFRDNALRLSLGGGLDQILESYRPQRSLSTEPEAVSVAVS